VLTAVGPILLQRIFFACPTCGQDGFWVDAWTGVDGFLTAGAKRMVTLAGTRKSFAQAEQLLGELAGWKLNEESIRQCCHAIAGAAAEWTAAEAPAAERFERAVGEAEVQIDGGKVNTVEGGWKEIKVAAFAHRKAGKPARPEEWETRKLPAPTARRVIAEIEGCVDFGERCRTEAARLGLSDGPSLSLLADGAEWIWNLADQHFPAATQVLDVYHAAEHIADGAKAVFGAETAAADFAQARGILQVLGAGYEGVVGWVGDLAEHMPLGGDGAALGGELNYFAGHKVRLGYADRLAQGKPIGSGMIEGTIKQMLNLRVKQTGARWCNDHVGPFVELIGLADSPEWKAFWER
jgi:hypothetical protein